MSEGIYMYAYNSHECQNLFSVEMLLALYMCVHTLPDNGLPFKFGMHELSTCECMNTLLQDALFNEFLLNKIKLLIS